MKSKHGVAMYFVLGFAGSVCLMISSEASSEGTRLAFMGVGAVLLLAAFLSTVFAKPKVDEIQLGADGIQSKDEFIAWTRVASVELEDHGVVVTLRDGYRSRTYHPPDAKAFVEEAHAVMERSREPYESGYRGETSPHILVRVVQDTSVKIEARVRAFRQLPVDERERVLESIADEKARKALTAMD